MKSIYQAARRRTEETLSELNIEHHMFYEPTTNSYWDQQVKVLTINLEPYGYEDCGRYHVKRDDLMDWMYDVGHTRTRTTRNTVAASKVLLDGFYKRKEPSPQALRNSYRNKDGLEKTLDRICYYNIRPVSNYEKPQSWDRGNLDHQGAIAECIKEELISLNPDIIIVSGQQTINAVRKLLCPNTLLSYLGEGICIGCKIVSVKHFSRPSYAPLSESICKAVDYLIENKPLK